MNTRSTPINLIHKYLKLKKIRISTKSIDNYVDNHPLPNSLRCISDFFDDNNIENMACRLELDQLSQIEGSFIVSLKAQQYPFVIVSNVSTDYFEMFSPTLNRIVKIIILPQIRTAI